MNSCSYPRSDRPTLQRRPLTAPAPIRPLCASATTMTPAAVSKPHPLRRAVSHSETGPTIEDAAAEGEGGGSDDADDVAAAAEELREIVASLSLRQQQQQQRRPPDITLPKPAVRRSSPSSSSYLSRTLPRTPSRGGSRNGGVGVGVPLKRKASLGSGGTGTSLSAPESAPMQVDTAAAVVGDELESLCASTRDDHKGRRRDTPPWIGLDGKRCEFLQDYLFLHIRRGRAELARSRRADSPPSRAMTRNPFLRQTTTTSSALGSLPPPPHPQIVRAATEPVLPPPPSPSATTLSTKT
jgi:hypothetical protein